MRRVRHFGTQKPPPRSPVTPELFELKQSRPPRWRRWGAVALGCVLGFETYLYMFTPYASHQEQLLFLLSSYGSATSSRNVMDVDVAHEVLAETRGDDELDDEDLLEEEEEEEAIVGGEKVLIVREPLVPPVAVADEVAVVEVEVEDVPVAVAPVVEIEVMPERTVVLPELVSEEVSRIFSRSDTFADTEVNIVGDDRTKSVVAMLSAKLEQEQSRLKAKEKELQEMRVELEAQARTMDRQLAVVHQDLEAEMTANLNSRLEIERKAMEERKNRALSSEIEHLEQEQDKKLVQVKEELRSAQNREFEKRMMLLKGLYEEIDKAETQLSKLNDRFDLIGVAYAAAEVAAAARTHLRHPAPFGVTNLASMAALNVADPLLADTVKALSSLSDAGLSTDPHLLAEFDSCARRSLEAALVPEDEGVLTLVGRMLTRTVIQPSEGMVVGTDADAILARAKVELQRDRLPEALAELEQLVPVAKKEMEPFLRIAKPRAWVDQSLRAIQAEAKSVICTSTSKQ